MHPWTKKYMPKDTSEIQGHNTSMEKLKVLIKSKMPVLLYGAPGCGKTSSVYAIANELGYEILELNASDVRNKKSIEAILGNSVGQMSLFGKGKIILVDEVDGLSGMKDRGGALAVSRLIKDSHWPIVATANDAWGKKLSPLRKVCQKVEFKTLNYLSVLKVLKSICEKEEVEYDEVTLKNLARRAGGDLRGAINDLQTLANIGKVINTIDDIGEREKTDSIMNALMLVFKSKKVENVLGAFDNVNADYREVMMWVDENLPKEYSGSNLVQAYHWISRADMFNGRIRRRQYWRFLVYIYSLLTAGVATAKDEKRLGFTSYRRSGRILKLWQAKMKNAKKWAIAEKVAEYNHTSKRTAYRNGGGGGLGGDVGLDDEEVAFLMR